MGRYVEIKVYTLDFKEYLNFAKKNTEERSLTLEDNFRNYLKSYPRSLAKRRRSYLKLMSYFKSLSY